MEKKPIAYHFSSWNKPYDLAIMAIKKNDDNVYILYSEYTGIGYKAHKKRIYSIENSPYFMHKNGRIYFYECDKVIIDENGFVQRTSTALSL